MQINDTNSFHLHCVGADVAVLSNVRFASVRTVRDEMSDVRSASVRWVREEMPGRGCGRPD